MMELSGEMDRLAQRLAAASRGEISPPLLFLGSDCARAAGVPNVDDITQQMADSLRGTVDLPRMRTLAEHLVLTAHPEADRTQLEARIAELASDPNLAGYLYERLIALPDSQRARVLLQVYDAIPVPLFYQDLTALLWAGCFTDILTTNVDTLLEQALNLGGFRPGSTYEVINLGTDRSPPPDWETSGSSTRLVRIFKLHGDLAQQVVNVTAEEIAAALEPQRMLVKGELRGDIVMVGYKFESPPIDHWLTLTSGEIWWVCQEPPDPNRLDPIAAVRPVNMIVGATGAPNEFFGILEATVLQPAPVTPPAATAEAVDFAAGAGAEPAVAVIDQADLLRTRISRSQAVLYSLEQQVAPSERNLPTQQQIDYQRGEIVKLEDKLRELSPEIADIEHVTSLIRQVVEAAERASVDEGTLAFLRSQLAVVAAEQASPQPNQNLVSAAIGATLVLAERLGPEVAQPELIQDLASYVTGASAWSRR
jgi:hypothetical protein